jgi:hypothetical protein
MRNIRMYGFRNLVRIGNSQFDSVETREDINMGVFDVAEFRAGVKKLFEEGECVVEYMGNKLTMMEGVDGNYNFVVSYRQDTINSLPDVHGIYDKSELEGWMPLCHMQLK